VTASGWLAFRAYCRWGFDGLPFSRIGARITDLVAIDSTIGGGKRNFVDVAEEISCL
jgi:hypothetical protein